MSFSKEQALDLLKKAKRDQRLAHAYLITGSRHIGIETVAEELASIVLDTGLLHLKEHPDFHVIEPESKSRKILTEQIRNLEEALHLKPQKSDYKVAIIHDADRMMTAAANAFLKTLEEPPDKTLLLLVSSLPEVLLETIRSRCIVLPLYSTNERPHEENEIKMASLMEQFFGKGAPTDVTAAFQLTRAFQTLLTEARKKAIETADEEFASEKKHYGKTTDGPWATRREEHFKATAEASALQQRSYLLEMAADYFARQLRKEFPHPPNNPDKKPKNNRKTSLLRALQAVETLQNSLERGTQESLALEAGFLRIMETVEVEGVREI